MSLDEPHIDAHDVGKALSERVSPATVAALAALGGQTRPQFQVNFQNTRAVDASREKVCEAIFQTALYGELPGMSNALNIALDVFDMEEAA